MTTTINTPSTPSNPLLCARQRVLYFCRHAEALHNVEERQAVAAARAQGLDTASVEEARKSVLNDTHLRDAPLSRKGLDEGKTTATQLRLLHRLSDSHYPAPQIVLVSPLRRALETATAMFADAKPQPRFVALEALREKRTGFCADECSSLALLEQEFPHVNFDDLQHNLNTTCSGEDNETLQIRARTFFTSPYLASLPHEAIAIVTHKAWLREFQHSMQQQQQPVGQRSRLAPGYQPVFKNAEVRIISCQWEDHSGGATLRLPLAMLPMEQALRGVLKQAVQDWTGDENDKTPMTNKKEEVCGEYNEAISVM